MKYMLLLCTTLALFINGFAQNEYMVTAKGMYYKIIPVGNGPAVPQNGMVRFHIEQRINDSIIFSSFGKGLSVVNMKEAANTDEHLELIRKMNSGDSLITLNLASDLMKNKELVLPDFIHAGDSLFQSIKVVDVFAAEKDFLKYKEAEKNRKLLEDQKTLEALFASEKIAAKKTKTGCYVLMLKKGTGALVAKGSKVSVKYIGSKLNGQVFDSNEIPGENKPLLEFETGKGNVIAGFDEGVSLLQKGGRCRIYVPSVYAYGEGGAGDAIAPNEILVFEIELVKVVPPVKPAVKKTTVKKPATKKLKK